MVARWAAKIHRHLLLLLIVAGSLKLRLRVWCIVLLLALQACNGLPESGVCDERTWLALLGADAKPEDLDEVSGRKETAQEDTSLGMRARLVV
jgi:hypothetical protein